MTEFAGLVDWSLEAPLLDGYPVLALVVFTAAFGLPLPAGLAVGLFASYVDGWPLVVAVGAAAATGGDLAGYEVGRAFGPNVLTRWGPWFGLTADRQAHAQDLLQRRAAVGLLATRSVLSAISSAVNPLAGAARYPRSLFVLYTAVGRLVWAVTYTAIGTGFGPSAELVVDFFQSAWMFLASLGAAAVLGYLLFFRRGRRSGHSEARAVRG
ncbi:MAG: hypothetical protein EPO26_17025 [Chloroflexota bacterium]|nr:MAG: hypothetical protein EPO26_17025 [Chloroflexota bacterium]